MGIKFIPKSKKYKRKPTIETTDKTRRIPVIFSRFSELDFVKIVNLAISFPIHAVG